MRGDKIAEKCVNQYVRDCVVFLFKDFFYHHFFFAEKKWWKSVHALFLKLSAVFLPFILLSSLFYISVEYIRGVFYYRSVIFYIRINDFLFIILFFSIFNHYDDRVVRQKSIYLVCDVTSFNCLTCKSIFIIRRDSHLFVPSGVFSYLYICEMSECCLCVCAKTTV